MMYQSPFHFIQALQKLPFNVDRCNGGYCFKFAVMLKNLFPEGELFISEDYDHVAFMWNGKLYDATGKVDLNIWGFFRPMTPKEVRRAGKWIS